MRISIAATNPCHVWALATELQRLGALGNYYSGYPDWKLPDSAGVSVRAHPFRTLVTYALHCKVPERFRPSNRSLFRWQDNGFDRWVGRVLEPADFHHGIPGQCLAGFRRAKQLGCRTVLNHATGPAQEMARILRPEYERLGMAVDHEGGISPGDLERIHEEFLLADYHCCASSIVKEQLEAKGVEPEKIWVIPYAADPKIWHPESRPTKRRNDEPFKLLFAGQVSLRKGLRFLLTALEQAGDRKWQLDVMGPLLEESRRDREAYRGTIPVNYHGPVRQETLAQAMRESDLLVLPSLEEGFGLVVVQALACGLPCAVSSMVGAKDMIVEGRNGAVFAVGDSAAIGAVLEEWEFRSAGKISAPSWSAAAALLLEHSAEVLTR